MRWDQSFELKLCLFICGADALRMRMQIKSNTIGTKNSCLHMCAADAENACGCVAYFSTAIRTDSMRNPQGKWACRHFCKIVTTWFVLSYDTGSLFSARILPQMNEHTTIADSCFLPHPHPQRIRNAHEETQLKGELCTKDRVAMILLRVPFGGWEMILP